MFLIFGIDTVKKDIPYDKLIICSRCGRYGRYNIYMLCKCFSLFFIPIFKWDRRYFVEASCCGALYELNQEVGDKLRKGENIEIRDKDLVYVENNNEWIYSTNTYSKRCINCGYIAQADFEYCPKCGQKL